jgi:uncharacterized membrane protein
MGVVDMKRFGEFLILAEMLPLIIALATPIADLFPKGTFDRINFPVLIALILLVGASFVIGLGLRSAAGRRMGGWIEQNALGRLPAYSALKGLTKGFVGEKEGEAFRPALLSSPDGERELAYVIEDHGVKIVNQDRVELLDTNLGEFTKVLGHWGVGVRDLLGKGGSR